MDGTLSDSKKVKIKDFVKMYMGKVIARHKGRTKPVPGDKVEEAEERGSQSTGETSPQQPGSSEKTPAVGGRASPDEAVLEKG